MPQLIASTVRSLPSTNRFVATTNGQHRVQLGAALSRFTAAGAAAAAGAKAAQMAHKDIHLIRADIGRRRVNAIHVLQQSYV
jgi:hypothetical protein